jgi:hypothetical protein
MLRLTLNEKQRRVPPWSIPSESELSSAPGLTFCGGVAYGSNKQVRVDYSFSIGFFELSDNRGLRVDRLGQDEVKLQEKEVEVHTFASRDLT